jgi:hypothetical protein
MNNKSALLKQGAPLKNEQGACKIVKQMVKLVYHIITNSPNHPTITSCSTIEKLEITFAPKRANKVKRKCRD